MKAKTLLNLAIGPIILVQVCNPSCVIDVPVTGWSNNCNISTRDGGIPRLTFLKCVPDLEFPNAGEWTNVENVKWAICQEILFISGEVLGQKPKGSFTKRRLSSCAPEVTVSGTKTITFNDFNADVEDLIDYDFWDAIIKNKNFMSFGFITCDGRWYQHDGAWDIELDEVIEDTSEGKSFFDGTITITSKDLMKPIICPGLLAAITNFDGADCYS